MLTKFTRYTISWTYLHVSTAASVPWVVLSSPSLVSLLPRGGDEGEWRVVKT